jgi:hypothetical protein
MLKREWRGSAPHWQVHSLFSKSEVISLPFQTFPQKTLACRRAPSPMTFPPLSSRGQISVPIPSVRHLRNCFRTAVIGDVRTGTFQTFWAAVGRRCPHGLEVSLDKPTSSRNSGELRVAFALVRAAFALVRAVWCARTATLRDDATKVAATCVGVARVRPRLALCMKYLAAPEFVFGTEIPYMFLGAMGAS